MSYPFYPFFKFWWKTEKIINFPPPPHFWSPTSASRAWKIDFGEILKIRPKTLKKTTIVIHKFCPHVPFLLLDGFTNHLWWMESKHYTFELPQHFFENAPTKRPKRLQRSIDENPKNHKLRQNYPMSYPFYHFFKFWWKIGKITNFLSPPHF